MTNDFRIRQKQLRFATWNVRTLVTPGASDILSDELTKYNIDVIALQETHWPDEGLVVTNDYIIYYSGTKNNDHHKGVGFAIKKQLRTAVLSFKAINERLCVLRLKGRFKNITIINVYAPINAADDEDKDLFYEKLEEEYERIPNYDIKVVIGDFNGQVGKEVVWKEIAGNESLHDISNDNGTRLLSLAVAGDLKVMSTIFPRKNIHKITWNHPDGVTKNQIDHVLIDKRHSRHITNVRSLRSAEVGSDHHLVLVKFQQRLAIEKKEKTNKKPPINLEKLKDLNIRNNFKEELQNRFDNDQGTTNEENNNVDDVWNNLKDILQETTAEVCGKKERREKKPWFDMECSDMIEKRKILKNKLLQNKDEESKMRYNNQVRETTKLMRRKKREWVKGLLQKAENDRTQNNARNFYRTLRYFKKGYQPKGYGVKNENGDVITEESKVLEIWKNYFSDLLNCDQTDNDEALEKFMNVQPETLEPTLEEVKQAIQHLKNNKAPGEDGLPAEVLKEGKEIVAREVHKIILEVWKTETIPSEWKEAIVVPILKKGDKQDCKNYRGISLLNTTYKVFSKILQKRLDPYTNSIIEEHQAGFSKGRSTNDQICIVKECIAKYWEYDKNFYLLFIDFSKAYDSLNRKKLWYKMERFGIPDKLINLVRTTVEGSQCKVKINGQLSSPFLVNTGVRQGDGTSPILFNIALEEALKRVKASNLGIHIGKTVNILAFADDVVIMAEKNEDLINLTRILINETKEVGLQINDAKTKFMYIDRHGNNIPPTLSIDGHDFDRCSEFKYLGVTLSDKNEESVEIQVRLNQANKSMHACNKLLSSKDLSRTSKIRLYKSIIRPVLTYGSENWIINKDTERKLVTFENKILRKIFGPTFEKGEWRIKHNKEIRDLYKEPDIVGEIKSGRLRWIGHILRKDEDSTTSQVWMNEPDGQRPRGRPKSRWKDRIKQDFRRLEIREEDAQDRVKWRQAVNEAKYQLGYRWPWQ